MNNQPQAPNHNAPAKGKNRVARWALILLVLLLLVSSLAVLGLWRYAYLALGSTAQTQQLLASISQLQPNFSYQHSRGNLRDGLQLSRFTLKVADTTININELTVQSSVQSLLLPSNLRHLLSGQRNAHPQHLNIATLKADTLSIYNHKPKTNEAFSYKPINLPVSLIVGKLTLNRLIIAGVGRPSVTLSQLQGEQIRWQGSKLTIAKQAQLAHKHVRIKQLKGTVDFSGHYLVNATCNLSLPALQRFNAQPIAVKATGDLLTTQLKASTNWPEPLHLTGTLAPFGKHTPFAAQVSAARWQLPFAKGEQIQLRNAVLQGTGSSQGLDFTLNTSLNAKHIPAGQYSAVASTNYKGLTISTLHASILGGQADLQGKVNWQQHVSWDVKGNLKQIKPQRYVNAAVGGLLPLYMTGSLAATGQVKQGNTSLWQEWKNSQNNAEQLQVQMQQQPQGWQINSTWRNLPLALPTGNQFSKQGSANILLGNNQVINGTVRAELSNDKRAFMPHFASNPSKHLRLPPGNYSSSFRYSGATPMLQMDNVKYSGANGSLSTQLSIMPASNKSPLKIAIFNNQINLHSLKRILPNTPINAVSGSANTAIIIDNRLNKKIIQLDQSNLTANLQLLGKDTPLQYNGNGIIHLLSPKTRQPEYAVALNGTLSSPLGQNTPINTSLQGDSQVLTINQLTLGQQSNPLLNATASIQLKPLTWDFKAQSTGLNVAYWLPKISAPITGKVTSQGQWSGLSKKITLQQTDINTAYNNQVLRITGDAQVDVHAIMQQWRKLKHANSKQALLATMHSANYGKWASSDINTLLQGKVTAQYGNATAALNAQNSGSSPWQLSFNLPQLQAFLPQAAGAIVGTIAANSAAQQADLAVTVNQLKLANWAAESGKVTGTLPFGSTNTGTVKANLYKVSGKQRFAEVAAEASGNLITHTINIATHNQGKAAALRLTGSLGASHWQGVMSHGVLIANNQRLEQRDPAAVSLRLQQPELTVAKHCWHGAGQLCFTNNISASKAQGQAALQVTNMNSANLAMLMPTGLFWHGQLNGDIAFAWQTNKPPTLNLNLTTAGGTIGLESEDPQDLPMIVDYDNITLNIATKPTGLDMRLDLQTPNVGTGYLHATVNPNTSPKTINGAMVLDNIQLAVLKRFFPLLHSIDGNGQLSGGISGALGAPQIYANFMLSNGAIVAKTLPLNLHNITLNAFVRGQEGSFNGSFNSGTGKAELSGNMAWPSGLKVNAALQGSNLAFVQPPMLSATLSPKLQVYINNPLKQMQIQGNIDVSDTLLTPPPSSDKVYKISPDVVLVDRNQPTTATNARLWDMDNLIHVNIKDNVNFAGYGAKIPLEGEIVLSQQRSEKLQANGEVRISRQSNVQAFGQTMLLRRGSILFNGALNYPSLDIEALKTIDNKDVGLSVYGTVLAPKVTLFNNAGLSEQESLNALITGKIRQENTANVSGFQSDANSTLAAAGLSFMLSGSHQLTNSIGRAVGLNALSIDASSENAETNIHVTGYLTPDLYVRYGRSVLTPVNKLTLRYQVNQRTYLEASSALERAVDIFYNWRF